jgi:hypothetical protein
MARKGWTDIRIPDDLIDRLDGLQGALEGHRELLQERGAVTRAKVIRNALVRGIMSLENSIKERTRKDEPIAPVYVAPPPAPIAPVKVPKKRGCGLVAHTRPNKKK